MFKYEQLIKSFLSDKDDFEIEGNTLRTVCYSCNPMSEIIHSKVPLTLNISLETGECHCQSCNAQGDIIDFIMNRGDLEKEQALDVLNNFLSLGVYADDNKLPIEFLEQLGMTTGDNSVFIPYYNQEKQEIAIKELTKNKGYKWKSGSKTDLYGLWKVNEFTDNSYIILVKSEQNAQVCWNHKIQAIALPEDIKFKKEHSPIFNNFEKVYICGDNGLDTTTFIRQVCEVLSCNKIFRILPSKVDENCQTPLALHLADKLDYNTLIETAEPIATNQTELQPSKKPHVDIGLKLIDSLKLKYYNNDIYTYKNGVYKLADEKMLKNCIVREIDINAKKNLCNESIEFVRNWLANDNEVTVNANYINYLNGLYDLRNQCLIPHTPDVFTVNQVHANCLTELPKNELVENYLNKIMCNDAKRKQALLEMIGYSQTSQTLIQQSMIWYGPTASNGKSTLARILTQLIGSENTSNVELQQFEKRFGAHEINQKLLNIVPELPSKKIDDVTIFKSSVTGDTIMADIKYRNRVKIQPYCKHIFTTNSLPQVADTTDGFYRRLNIMLFENKFEVNNNFDITVFFKQENIDYLANIGLRAFINMLNTNNLKFANEEESQQILKEYKMSNDTILGFLNDKELFTSIYNYDVRTTSMWSLYRNYCIGNGLSPVKKQEFYRDLTQKYEFTKKTLNGYDYFYKYYPLEENQ